MIYPPNQKPPIWSIDPGVLAYNCQKAGMPHPVLAMPMWEGAGNRALDYSGHGNHGTFVNDPVWSNGGILFDAATEYIFVDNPKIGNLANSGTFFMMYSYVSLGLSFPRIFGFSLAKELELYAAAGLGGRMHVDNTALDRPGNLTDGNLKYIFGRYDISANWQNLTVNLDSQDASNVTDSLTLADLYIGNRGLTDRSCSGYIYSFCFFDSALDDTQVKFMHNNPYFMYQIPEELYGYVAAVAGISVPLLMQQMNQFDGGTYALC